MTMMAEKVGELAVATKTLTIKVQQGDEERERDRRWFKLACVVFAAAFVLAGLAYWDQRQFSRDNRTAIDNTASSLAILQKVTGPEATASQVASTQLLVNQIIEAVDCKTEENNRIVLESLRPQIPNVQIPEVRDACREVRSVPAPVVPSTTTTTNP
jgi:hypothetical protein